MRRPGFPLVWKPIAALLLLAAAPACEARVEPRAPDAERIVPALTGRVVDQANLLAPDDEARLTARLTALEAKTHDQLVIVTLPGLGKASIEEMGLALGRSWGVGQKNLDNGVLLIVAPTERLVRIEVGYGLEALLTDEMAQEIIDRDILPQFRSGRFAAGIEAGAAKIETLLRGDPLRPRYRSRKKAA